LERFGVQRMNSRNQRGRNETFHDGRILCFYGFIALAIGANCARLKNHCGKSQMKQSIGIWSIVAVWLIGIGLVVWMFAGCTVTEVQQDPNPPRTCKEQVWDDSVKAWVWHEIPCDTVKAGLGTPITARKEWGEK